MPRILTPAIVLALLLGLASSASAQPFVIVYASEVACDLSATLSDLNPTAQPDLPAIEVPVGGSTTLDLCFIVLPHANSTEGQIDCEDGTGTPSCAEQVQFTASGIKITAFSATGSGPEADPDDLDFFPRYKFRFTDTLLTIAGGHPIVGLQGSGFQGLRWGSVTVEGLAFPGKLELTSIGGYVNASTQRVSFPGTVVVRTIDTCGDGVLDVVLGEECDDGNENLGDGCSPNCRFERLLEVTGSVGVMGGSLDVTIGSVGVTLDLSFLPNAPAADVVLSLATSFDDEPSFIGLAVQVDDLGVPGTSGRFLLADEIMTATLSITDGDLVVAVPEPGHLAMLAAGIAMLLGLERRRSGLERHLR